MTSLPIFDVAGLGTVVVDHQLLLSEYPAANSKVDALSEHVQVGGPVPTALVQLARWGKTSTFIGTWATDRHGAIIYGDLKAEGIDLKHSTIHPEGRSGMAQVWVDQETGTRTIACNRGSHEIKPRVIPTTRLLHLDGWSAPAALDAARQVQDAEGLVVLDAGSPKPGMEQLLPLVDILICPANFMERYFHDPSGVAGAQRLLDLGIEIVIHTHGEKGCEVYLPDRQFHQVAFQVDAVDTTGAGDVFSAGVIYGTLEDWTIEDTIRFAAAASAFKCAKMGNRDALPELHDVAAMISGE